MRGYELDSYGHVNNAVYLNYFEHARWEFFDELSLLPVIHSNQLFLVVTDIHVRYMREARLGDLVEVNTQGYIKSPFLLFRQKLINIKTGLTLARAEIKTIFIDALRKPVEIPSEVQRHFDNSRSGGEI